MKRYDNYQKLSSVWSKSIPNHWNIVPLCSIAKEKSICNCSHLELLSVYLDDGVIPFSKKGEKRTNITSSDTSKYQRVDPGDFVLNNQQAWRGSVGISKYVGIVSPAYVILSMDSTLQTEYANYLMRCSFMVSQFYIASKGVGSIQRNISLPELKRSMVLVPQPSEQDQIVRYLDWQTSRINKLINGYKRQIELLEERKRTVTFYSVVYGLNHNIEMKDSIIPWIDHIPAHWSVKNLAQLFTQVKCKNTNLYEKNLLSLSYGKIKRRNIDATGGLLPESFEGYNIIEKDDIVLRLTDLQNDHKSLRTGIATERGIVTSAYVTIRNFSENNPQYLHYYLHAFDLNKGFYNVGASGVRQSLNWDNIRTLQILLPPLNEQNQIVDYINRASTKIDEIKKTYEKKIELFLEYRTRLISDVVTGQIDVRDIDIPEYVSEEEYNDDLQDNNNDMEGDINE